MAVIETATPWVNRRNGVTIPEYEHGNVMVVDFDIDLTTSNDPDNILLMPISRQMRLLGVEYLFVDTALGSATIDIGHGTWDGTTLTAVDQDSIVDGASIATAKNVVLTGGASGTLGNGLGTLVEGGNTSAGAERVIYATIAGASGALAVRAGFKYAF